MVGEKINGTENAILLRTDIHQLFEDFYVWLEPTVRTPNLAGELLLTLALLSTMPMNIKSVPVYRWDSTTSSPLFGMQHVGQ